MLSFALSSAGLLCTGHSLVSFPRLVVVFVLVFFLSNIFVSARLLWFPVPLQHYYWSWTLLYRCSLDCYWYWSLDSPGLPFASLGWFLVWILPVSDSELGCPCWFCLLLAWLPSLSDTDSRLTIGIDYPGFWSLPAWLFSSLLFNCEKP